MAEPQNYKEEIERARKEWDEVTKVNPDNRLLTEFFPPIEGSLESVQMLALKALMNAQRNRAQKYLAQANRQIAELTVQIAAQRAIVKHALDTGQRLEMAESLLDALEGSLRIFEKHRIFLLSLQRIVPRPTASGPELLDPLRSQETYD